MPKSRWSLYLILLLANTVLATQFGDIPVSQVLGTPTITNDSNITLTLGGTPTDSLLKPFSITVGWTGTLSTARGGVPTGGTTGQVLAKNSNANNDLIWSNAGGGGTVTSFSSGDLSPLFTTTETNPTTTPALSFTLSTAAANTVFGNNTASTAAPVFSSSPRFTAIGNLTTNGFVKTGGGIGTLSIDTTAYEPGLGNPGTNGFVLSSTTTGTRSWVAQTGGAPSGATYITQTADGTLSAEQALSTLGTGLLKNTTGTGVLSIAAAGTDYVAGVANPGAQLLGLTAINGSATTAMRSDGAPALSQAIAPTWTAAHIWQIDDANTGSYTIPLTIKHSVTGTATTGAGVGMEYYVESGGGTVAQAARDTVAYSNATAGSEAVYHDWWLNNAASGGLLQKMRLHASGGLSVGTGFATDPGAGWINATAGFKVNNSQIALSNLANLSAVSKLMGSGSAGSSPVEITLGSGLSMSSQTLNASFTGLGGNWTLAQGPSITAGKLLGRDSASAGIPQEITLGTNLSMSGTTLNATGGGGGAPTTSTYITQTADATLSAEQALSTLGTGLLKNTTGTGVLSIATAGTDYLTGNQTITLSGDVTGSGTTAITTTNAFAKDGTFRLQNTTTTSKQAAFDLTNITTATTRTINVPDANSTTAQAKSSTASQWLNSMSAQGVFSASQPAFTDISGTATNAQLPATLSSKTLDDTNTATFKDGSFTLENTTTTTKKAIFGLSNITAGQTRTINVPDANSTTIQPDTGATNNFLTAVSAQGLISKAQPSFSNLSGSLATTQLPALTGSVTMSAGTNVTTLVNIPDNTGASGRISWSEVTSPATPAAGLGSLYYDNLDHRLHDLNNGGTVGTTVVAKTKVANQFIDSLSSAGVFTTSQVNITDLASMTASRLVGRGSASAGSPQEITLGTNLSMSGTTLNASGGGGSPGGSDTYVQFNDSGVFGGDSGLTFNKSTDLLTLLGDFNMSTDGSSSGSPRTFGFTNLTSGEASRVQFGDPYSAFQLGFGSRMQIYAWHGIELRGGRTTASAPSFVGGGGISDPSVSIYADGGTSSVPLAVVANASQSANLTEWKDSGNVPLVSVTAGGGIRWASGAGDTGLFRNTGGVLEINNGTAGGYRDLLVRNITISGTCSGCSGTFTPGGSNTQVQWNNAGSLAGISTLTTNGTVVTQQGGANFLLVDPTDTTKKAQFDLSNIAAGATRTVAVPNGGNSTTVIANTGGSNLFVTGISTAGVISNAQPAFSNLSGSVAPTQMTSPVFNTTNTATPTAITNADTYVVGSGLTINAGDFNVLGATYHIQLQIAKTGSGTAGGPFIVRIGTAGTIADTSANSLALPAAGTAVVDTGMVDIWVRTTTTGASGILTSITQWTHNLTTTGLWNSALQTTVGGAATGSAVNLTTATKVGVSYTAGASGSHTIHVVKAEFYRP